jgi:hypothetical protein
MTKAGRFSDKGRGRLFGVLLVVQMACLIGGYAMLHPISRGNFLVSAAGAAGQDQAAYTWLVLNCALTVAMSLLLAPLMGKLRWGGTLLFYASASMLGLQMIDAAYVQYMITLSEQHASGLPVAQAAAQQIASARRLVHYAELVSIDVWMFLMFGLLFWLRRVPRWVAGFGFVTVGLHFGGLLLPMILGGSGVVAMGASMALGSLVLAIWLLVRGFSTNEEAIQTSNPHVPSATMPDA